MVNNLRFAREAKGMTQLELGARTRIAPGTISNIERGKIFPYRGWRERIAAALAVDERAIFPEVDEDGRR